MKMHTGVAALLIVLLGFAPFTAFAADESRPVPAGLQLCESYVRPYDVSATVSADLREVAQGAVMAFMGQVENRGVTQLTMPTVYVRITDRSSSPRIVELLPATLIRVPGETEQYTFLADWAVSAGIPPGEYEADAILYTDGRSEVVGSLNPLVTKTPYIFSVVSVGKASGIAFDARTVTLNNKQVPLIDGSFAAPQDGPITVGIQLSNNTPAPLKSVASWRVYTWNSPRTERLLLDTTGEVKVHPGTNGFATLTIDDSEHVEYFVESRLDNAVGNTAAFIHIVRENAAEPRLVTSGVTQVEGTEGQVAYACIRSDFLPTDDVKFNVYVNDSFLGFSWHVAKKSYEGSIPTNESYALSAAIGGRTSGTVVSELYRNNILIDSSETAFGPGHRMRDIGIVVGVIIVLVLAAVAIGRRRMVQ